MEYPENSSEKEEEDYHFIYFIDTHEKNKKIKIYLSDDYEEAETLEFIKEKEIQKESNEFISEVYRFKIIPGSLEREQDNKYQILIIGEEKDKVIHQYKLKFNDESKDYYEYDFHFEELGLQPLSQEEQFEIYVENLRKIFNKKWDSLENENLIISTHRILDMEGKKYNFFFYLLIFMECFKTKYIQNHLLKFKPEKIGGLGNFPESKIKLIKNTLNIISKNPSKSLNLQNSQDEFIELFYSILLYFNMNFQKEKIIDMFHDEKIIKYLSKKLITFYKLFQDLILPKEIVSNLIKRSKTFDEILGFLFYIGKDIIEFLQLIYSKLEFIKNIYEYELNKLNEENENKDKSDKREMKKIEIDRYIIPKKK